MKIQWLGNAGFRIITDSTFIVDPFIQLPINEHINDWSIEGDNILVTHGHIDHLYTLATKPHIGHVYCTKTPTRTLLQYGWRKDIDVVDYGEELVFKDTVIKVYKGQHIHFDLKLILKTLNPIRVFKYRKNLSVLIKTFKFPENDETVLYEMSYHNQRIVIMGSLGLDNDYPISPDVLIMPYQGNTHLVTIAENIINKVKPKMIILSHFNDAFPPISRHIDTGDIESLIKEKYPKIYLLKPDYLKIYDI